MSDQREIKMSLPKEFDGDRTKTKAFLADVRLYLKLNHSIYDTDDKKIGFILSFMKGGTAGPWKMLKVDEAD